MKPQASARDGERYELLGELASGGMATVYVARMHRPTMGFSRLVAIKCMHPQFAKDPSFVSMFEDEARLTARLRHPNIVPTLDIVAEDGQLLLVMEYVEGASLAHLLRQAHQAGVRVPVPIACAIVHDLLLGLHEAHQAKDDEGAPLAIVHRDVSPQNVLVGLDGLARVLDFGVARARQNTHRSNDNEIKGKIPYMPPEQLFGEALDHKVDVYAAGVTLWEALVCERLFDGPSETALVKKISEDPIAKPSARIADLPPAIDAVVMRALARDPGDRYETALAMAQAIAGIIALPTRTEVSAWVRQYVAPREVPSGSKLPDETRPGTLVRPATEMLAVLERVSMLRPSVRRPAVALPVTPRARLAIAVAAVAVAFAAGGIAVARAAKVQAASPLAHAAHVLPAKDRAPTLPEAPKSQPTDATPASPAVVIAPYDEMAPPHKGARARVPPASAAAAPANARVARSSSVAATTADKGCKIPYTIDRQGQKHFKAECFD